jgi:hypothetical protein
MMLTLSSVSSACSSDSLSPDPFFNMLSQKEANSSGTEVSPPAPALLLAPPPRPPSASAASRLLQKFSNASFRACEGVM